VKRKVKVADPNVETMEIQLRLTELQNQVAVSKLPPRLIVIYCFVHCVVI